MNLGALVIQLLGTILWCMLIYFICDFMKNEVFNNFKHLAWYKKIFFISLIPVGVFIFGWVFLFIWLGPEHYKLIMYI